MRSVRLLLVQDLIDKDKFHTKSYVLKWNVQTFGILIKRSVRIWIVKDVTGIIWKIHHKTLISFKTK